MIILNIFAFTFDSLVGVATIVSAVPTIVTLSIKISRLKRKTRKLDELNPSLDVLANYKEVWSKVIGILQEELKTGSGVKIKNIGLDLEKILPDLKEFIDDNVKIDKSFRFSYQGLIINPDSPLIAPMIDHPSNIKKEYVLSAHRKLQDYKDNYKDYDNINLNVKAYDMPPVIHGIVINKMHLFLGFTEIDKHKLYGSNCPYIYLKFDRKIAATAHYFAVFKKWFDHYWEK